MIENKSKKNISNRKILQQLLPYFSPYKKETMLAIIALGITSLMILCFGKAASYGLVPDAPAAL